MADRPTYRFRFFRAGSVDQVVLDAGALENLASLDEKLWLALACPTHGLELDARTLDLIDTDKDGRIRPPELLAAVKWAGEVFDDLGDLFKAKGSSEMPLSLLSKETDTGREILEGARHILKNLGRHDADVIALADVLDTEKIFVETKLNGDGIVPVNATDDEPTQKAITDILTVMGSVKDRSGQPGIDKAKADAFFEQATTYAAWLDKADAVVNVLGDATEAAVGAMNAVRPKVDDYFMRGRLAAYASDLTAPLDVAPAEATALAGLDLAPEDTRVGRWPLAHVQSGALSLVTGLNPAWAGRVEALARLTVTPLLGADAGRSLNEAQWKDIQARLAPFEAWSAKKPDLGINALGPARIRELLSSGVKDKVFALIAEDAALEAESNRIEAVEKAIRLRRDLVTLTRNFINFADFYGKREAIFQAGTLYIDGRSCDLCLPVHDVPKHATLAGLAKAYLVYCDCTRKGSDKRIIVGAVTGGSVDNLMVGRNGVFYDRKGDDWDATITKIIENPISVRQAFLAPYKRFVRLIEEQVAKRAAAADEKSQKRLDAHAVSTAHVGTEAEKPAAAAPSPLGEPPKKLDIGTIAAIGVAVGGVATFLSSIFATFFGLGMWMPIGILALLLAISGPSMIIAYLKLSQRNIGPILDANGWAVNAFARINVPFGGALTKLAALPKGASRTLDDPFAEKTPPYRRYVFLVVALVLVGLWAAGKLDRFLPAQAHSDVIFHRPPPTPAPSGAPAP